jgi:aerobic carbon-monoxide dehydrogenase small subunit
MGMDDTTARAFDLVVDGTRHRPCVDPDRFLSQVLRDDLGLKTVKEACAEGECGSCTVLVGGLAVDSCIYPVGLVDGRPVETAQSEDDPVFEDVRQALIHAGAIQCGFCTPGIVAAAAALLKDDPSPSGEQVRAALAGNLCRCTGYQPIVDAIRGGVVKGSCHADD